MKSFNNKDVPERSRKLLFQDPSGKWHMGSFHAGYFFSSTDNEILGVDVWMYLDDAVSETDFEKLVSNVEGWHRDRNLVKGSSAKDQFAKLIQEAGELSESICKKQNPADDIGDMLVVLILLALQHQLTIRDCLAAAWEDIKDRKGKMVDGVFVKEDDLPAMYSKGRDEGYWLCHKCHHNTPNTEMECEHCGASPLAVL